MNMIAQNRRESIHKPAMIVKPGIVRNSLLVIARRIGQGPPTYGSPCPTIRVKLLFGRRGMPGGGKKNLSDLALREL
jgi:hypothetical protein